MVATGNADVNSCVKNGDDNNDDNGDDNKGHNDNGDSNDRSPKLIRFHHAHTLIDVPAMILKF